MLSVEVERQTVTGEKEELQVLPGLTAVQRLVQLAPPGGLGE